MNYKCLIATLLCCIFTTIVNAQEPYWIQAFEDSIPLSKDTETALKFEIEGQGEWIFYKSFKGTNTKGHTGTVPLIDDNPFKGLLHHAEQALIFCFSPSIFSPKNLSLSNYVAMHQRKNAFFFEFTAPKFGSSENLS